MPQPAAARDDVATICRGLVSINIPVASRLWRRSKFLLGQQLKKRLQKFCKPREVRCAREGVKMDCVDHQCPIASVSPAKGEIYDGSMSSYSSRNHACNWCGQGVGGI
eukprot:2551973-Amphidinium_carterae.1